MDTRWARLSNPQCQQLHNASLEILERTGARLFNEEAVELVRSAGGKLDDGNRVRVPAPLVERALQSAPKQVTLYDRLGHPAIPLGGFNTFFGPGSDCLNILDHRTGERRPPLCQDLVEGIRLCDALPEMSFVMSLCMPSEVPQEIADRYQFEIMLRHTTKPIVFVSYETSGCVDALRMAEAVAGGAAALRERPFVACYINATSGLLHNAEALEKLLLLAEKGLPAVYVPVVSGGTTGPVTAAGCLALANAGVLVGLLVSQLKREGTPVIIPGFGGDALDLRTMVDPYCGPDARGLAQSLAHFYQLPMFSIGGASESKIVDQQAAIEAGLDLLACALAGGHLVHDCGYLESGLTFSLAQLAICNEAAGWIRHVCQPVEIDAETLALDLIEGAGPEGQFLKLPHTRRHMRERWYPTLFERDNFAGWKSKGSKTLAERAAEQVSKILASHRPEPLSQSAEEAIRRIVACAEEQAGRAPVSPASGGPHA